MFIRQDIFILVLNITIGKIYKFERDNSYSFNIS